MEAEYWKEKIFNAENGSHRQWVARLRSTRELGAAPQEATPAFRLEGPEELVTSEGGRGRGLGSWQKLRPQEVRLCQKHSQRHRESVDLLLLCLSISHHSQTHAAGSPLTGSLSNEVSETLWYNRAEQGRTAPGSTKNPSEQSWGHRSGDSIQ